MTRAQFPLQVVETQLISGKPIFYVVGAGVEVTGDGQLVGPGGDSAGVVTLAETREEAEQRAAIRNSEEPTASEFITKHLSAVPFPLSRVEYEQRAAAAGVELLPDGHHYFGSYAFPEYSARDVVRFRLAMQRMTSWKNEVREASAPQRTALEAQIEADYNQRQEATVICRYCGQGGQPGLYPFSTLAGGDVCDDCIGDGRA